MGSPPFVDALIGIVYHPFFGKGRKTRVRRWVASGPYTEQQYLIGVCGDRRYQLIHAYAKGKGNFIK